jgi:5-methyltetrahydropteroyltriglutamate--homocysteine methyltransferase
MLNHFWQKIPSFQGETKPKPITPHDPHVFHPAAICRGPILDSIDLGLVEEFRTVSSFARKPVKVTMTGPHLLAAVAYDEYYNDTPKMMADFGKLLHQNFKRLTEAGCKHIQIDEPYFTASSEGEVAAAISVINEVIADLPEEVHVKVHICQGTFSRARNERFRDGDVFRRVFEGVVETCIGAGLVWGEDFAVDASLIQADANKQRSIAGQDWRRDRDPARSSLRSRSI